MYALVRVTKIKDRIHAMMALRKACSHMSYKEIKDIFSLVDISATGVFLYHDTYAETGDGNSSLLNKQWPDYKLGPLERILKPYMDLEITFHKSTCETELEKRQEVQRLEDKTVDDWFNTLNEETKQMVLRWHNCHSSYPVAGACYSES